MIEVKLSFPNLEAAITALAAVRQATGSEAPAPKPEVKDAAKPEAKAEGNDKAAAKAAKAAEAAEKAKAAETAATAATAQTAASPTPPTESKSPGTSSEAGGATKEQVSAAITEAVKADRAKVVEVLTSFGAKSGKDLKPEQYADFLAKLAAAMAVTEDLAA